MSRIWSAAQLADHLSPLRKLRQDLGDILVDFEKVQQTPPKTEIEQEWDKQFQRVTSGEKESMLKKFWLIPGSRLILLESAKIRKIVEIGRFA